MLVRMWEKGRCSAQLVEVDMVQPLWKTAVQFLKKLKTELASDLALSLLGVWPQEMKADFQEISAHPRSQQHHSP